MGYYTNMLKDSAVLKTVAGYDENGRPNISELNEINCKIEFKSSLVLNSAGEEVTSSGRLYTESSLKIGDILEVRDKVYTVVSVSPYYPIDSSLFVINEVYFA